MLTYLIIYLLTPWCRVLLEKLTGLQLVKKFPAFHGTRRFITALTRVRHLSLSWASSIQSIYPHPTSWRSNLILSTHLRLGISSGFMSNILSYITLVLSGKVNWSLYRTDVAQKVGIGIALFFNDRGTGRGWVVSVTPRPHFTPGKDPVPIVQEAGWAPESVWTGGKSRPHRDSIPAPPGVVSRFIDWATRPVPYPLNKLEMKDLH